MSKNPLVGSERRRRWRAYRKYMKKRKLVRTISGKSGHTEFSGQKVEITSWEITRKIMPIAPRIQQTLADRLIAKGEGERPEQLAALVRYCLVNGWIIPQEIETIRPVQEVDLV